VSMSLPVVLSALIGSISFAGSMVAFGKLHELVSGRPIVYPGQKVGNLVLLGALLSLGVVIVAGPQKQVLLIGLIAGALLFGVLFVLPIGGGHMPRVISPLDRFTGPA